MRITAVSLLLLASSICIAQTDSMLVEKSDGTVVSYPVNLISHITFSEVTRVQDQDLVKKTLTSFALYQNYPNPFNPSTTIQYEIPKAGNAEVQIFDIQGRLVRTLTSSFERAGSHLLTWDSRSDRGTQVSSGTYFCRVSYNGSLLVKKLLLLK